MTTRKYSFEDGQHFVADLADALGVSFKAVDSHSHLSTFRKVKPTITQDYILFGENGCFQGGATLARIRLFRDVKFNDGLIVSITQLDREVIPHVRRLFQEQAYSEVGFSYMTGPDVPNKVELLRRRPEAA